LVKLIIFDEGPRKAGYLRSSETIIRAVKCYNTIIALPGNSNMERCEGISSNALTS
jgi:hypothetical protein